MMAMTGIPTHIPKSHTCRLIGQEKELPFSEKNNSSVAVCILVSDQQHDIALFCIWLLLKYIHPFSNYKYVLIQNVTEAYCMQTYIL